MRLRDRIADAVCAVLGRRRFGRLARFLWLRSRLDVRNDLNTNGERDVQEAVLRRAKRSGSATIFDIGANVGRWSASLVSIASRLGLPDNGLTLHLFEPAPRSADYLEQMRQDLPQGIDVVLNRVAVAAEVGSQSLYLAGPTAETNSLVHSPDDTSQQIEVPCTTIDQYCHDRSIGHVDLCKIDAEGADYDVLKGSFGSLKAGILDWVQFEYNSRWISSRTYLRDVFRLGEPLGLQVGKITPKGIERYETWDRELEVFQQGQYLLGGDFKRLGLPVFPWWKPTSEGALSDTTLIA